MSILRLIALNLKDIDMRMVEFVSMSAIRVHYTPQFSMEFDGIVSGDKVLSPAGFFLDDPNDPHEADRVVFARQSEKRSQLIFENETLSASMSEKEQKLLGELFESSNFVSQNVKLFYEGEELAYLALPPKVADEISMFLSQHLVKPVLDIEGEEITLNDIREEIERETYERIQREENLTGLGSLNSKIPKDVSVKENLKENADKIINRSLMSVTLGVISGALEYSSRVLEGLNSKWKFAAFPLRGASKLFAVFATASAASIAKVALGGEYL